ncbi:MAG: AhpC/TSA family protein [Bacteroidales bacterium]|nr:AhpC/TSA family protein [Bacteroidales bacterium]
MTETRLLLTALTSLVIGLSGCDSSSDYCVVKGNIKGVPDGSRLELQDGWNNCKIVGTTTVKDGSFEFHPKVTGPVHVYLYQDDFQLQDFILESGTVFVDVDAAEGDEYGPGAKGTPSNDVLYRLRSFKKDGKTEALRALADSVLEAPQTGPLTVLLADSYRKSALQAHGALERLSPQLAGLRYVKDLKEEMSLLIKTEPRDDYKPQYIDLEYSDIDGNPVRLSSVVNDPRNRYVLLDFWATWCGPCVRAFPQMKELYNEYHGKGLEIVSISIDESEKRWKSFLQDNKFDWITIRDDLGGRSSSEVWKNYAISVIPMYILIDGDTGEILLRDNHPDLAEVFSTYLP